MEAAPAARCEPIADPKQIDAIPGERTAAVKMFERMDYSDPIRPKFEAIQVNLDCSGLEPGAWCAAALANPMRATARSPAGGNVSLRTARHSTKPPFD